MGRNISKNIMGRGTTWILFSILPVISPMPGPVKVGLEDVAMEMVLCESLDGACNRLTEENLEPVVMKLEKAVEAKELDFGNDLYDELETRVGRLLCGLDYDQFCTPGRSYIRRLGDPPLLRYFPTINGNAPGGRSVLQEESALCRLEGINCKSRGRTLGDILDAKKQLLKAVLGIEDGSGDGSGSGDGDANGDIPEEGFINADGDIEPSESSGDEESSGEGSGEGSGEDLLSTIFDSKVAAVDAVLDAKKDIVQTVITGVAELKGDLADVANDAVEAKTTLAKSSVKAVAVVAEGAVNLAQAAVKGAIDTKVAAVDASVNIVDAVVETKASIFKSVFNLLKKKVNIVLCSFDLKCPVAK